MTQESIKNEVMPVVQQAKELQVTDSATEQTAAEILKVIKSLLKKVQEQFGPAVEAAHKAHKEALAVKKGFEDPLKKAEKQVKASIGSYRARLEAEAAAERQRLEEEARKKAEEERKKEAETLRKAGEAAAAAVKMHTPVNVEPVKPVVLPPKPQGFHTRANWKAKVVDIKSLCHAVSCGVVSTDAVLPNMPVLNALARQDKGKMCVPGVLPYNDAIVSSSGSKDISVTEF